MRCTYHRLVADLAYWQELADSGAGSHRWPGERCAVPPVWDVELDIPGGDGTPDWVTAARLCAGHEQGAGVVWRSRVPAGVRDAPAPQQRPNSPHPVRKDSPMIPENTADRDPFIHLAGAFGGMDNYITDMESAGQRQLVHSDVLPTQTQDDEATYLALGFTFAEPDKRDPMFRPATLPRGWMRRGSDHAMWSYIDDALGRERVAIFYKAAFYDRKAFMRLTSVSSYAYKVLHGDVVAPTFDGEWCTRAAFVEALAEMRQRADERVALYENSDAAWAADELPKCRADLAAIDRLIAKYGEVSS